MEGRKEGIQVWRRSHKFWNVFLNYSARVKTSRGIHALTNVLCDKIYGARVHALHILDCRNRKTITAQNGHVKECENIVQSYAPVVFEGELILTSLLTAMTHLEVISKSIIQIL